MPSAGLLQRRWVPTAVSLAKGHGDKGLAASDVCREAERAGTA